MNIKNSKVALANKNLKFGYLLSFLEEIYFTLSLWYVFGEQFRGWNPLQIFILFGLGWELGFIFEIPTGLLADKFGRLRIFRISKILVAIAYLILGLSTNFIILGFAMIINAVGSAGISGTIEPVVGLSLKDAGKADSVQKYQGHSFAISRVGRLLALTLAPFLYRFWPPLIFLAYSFMCILVFLASFKVKDTASYAEASETKIIKHLKETLFIVKHSPGLSLVMSAAFLSLNTEIIWFLTQPIGLSLGLNENKISFLFMLSVLITSISAFVIHRIKNTENKIGLIIVYNIFCNLVGSFLLFKFNNTHILILVITFTAFLIGMFAPSVQTYFQHNMKSSNLSTCMSVYFFIFSSSLVIMNLVMGWILKNWGIQSQLKFNMVFGLICLVLAIPLIVRSRKDNKPIEGSVIPAE